MPHIYTRKISDVCIGTFKSKKIEVQFNANLNDTHLRKLLYLLSQLKQNCIRENVQLKVVCGKF